LTGTGIATVRRYLKARLIPFIQPGGRKGRVLIPIDEPPSPPPTMATTVSPNPPSPPAVRPIPGRKPKWMEE
jgi:hypothetical protein